MLSEIRKEKQAEDTTKLVVFGVGIICICLGLKIAFGPIGFGVALAIVGLLCCVLAIA